jgi:hypothetical protein
MTSIELTALVAAGERRHVEFKSRRSRDDRTRRAEVVKAVLAMANTRDGGKVLIGVTDEHVVEGFSSAECEGWADEDCVRELLLPFADPWVAVTVSVVELPASSSAAAQWVAVLEVAEFEAVPVFARKEGKDPKGELVLKAGRLYVRALEKYAFVEVSTPEQMRELMTLGVEKGINAYIRTSKRAGVDLVALGRIAHSDQYSKELERFRRGE